MVFETHNERPNHTFWKTLIRTFLLKDMRWPWQKRISDVLQCQCATSKELDEPREGEVQTQTRQPTGEGEKSTEEEDMLPMGL
jgi:hypothetical protein